MTAEYNLAEVLAERVVQLVEGEVQRLTLATTPSKMVAAQEEIQAEVVADLELHLAAQNLMNQHPGTNNPGPEDLEAWAEWAVRDNHELMENLTMTGRLEMKEIYRPRNLTEMMEMML